MLYLSKLRQFVLCLINYGSYNDPSPLKNQRIGGCEGNIIEVIILEIRFNINRMVQLVLVVQIKPYTYVPILIYNIYVYIPISSTDAPPPTFINCPQGEAVTYNLTPLTNSATVDLVIQARDINDQPTMISTIEGPVLPAEIGFEEVYRRGRDVVLQASDSNGVTARCAFTLKLVGKTVIQTLISQIEHIVYNMSSFSSSSSSRVHNT